MLDTSFFCHPPFSLFTRSKKKGFEIFSLSGSPLLCPVLLLLLTLSPVLLSFSSTPPLIVFFAATPHQTVSWCFQQWEARNQVSSHPNPLFGPPKNLQSLAINTEPMDCELPPSSPSPLPPPVLPDLADFGTMTTPIQTSSVSCYTDSFENLEFAALLKENEAVDTLEQILADTRKELGAQKA